MAQSQQSQIIYTVHATERPSSGKASGAAQTGEQTSDMDKALKSAENLFNTGKFLKIEVKKKYTEEKTGRQIEITLKVFEGKTKKDRSLLILCVATVLAGAGAFSGAYFLTKPSAPPAETAPQDAQTPQAPATPEKEEGSASPAHEAGH